MYDPNQPPQPRKQHSTLFWLGLLAAILLVCLIGGAILTNSLQPSTTVTQVTPTDVPTDTPIDTPIPTATLDTSIATSTPVPTLAPAKWTTIQSFRGNGTKKTAVFSVPDDWRINWTCTGFSSVDGAMGVIVYGSDNSTLDVAVNATCKAGSKVTKDSTEEHQGGDIYLSIDATGDWTLEVQVLQ